MQLVLTQIGWSALFYVAVVALFRIAGKRMAGQTTTFDLIILISLAVTIQQATLSPGRQNALLFVVTVFSLHLLLARLCLRFPTLRLLVRGRSSELIRDGQILYRSLRDENVSIDELRAGLRKLGIEDPALVHTAHLEETGQISAVRFPEGAAPKSSPKIGPGT